MNTIEITNPRLLVKQIDEIGALDAQIAELTAQRDALVAQYKELGAANYAGKSYTLEISECDRKSVAYAKVVAELKVEQELLAKYTSVSHVVSAKIKARTN